MRRYGHIFTFVETRRDISGENTVSVESPPCDSFLRLFRNYVYYHYIFPKINEKGGWDKSGGLENFSKINKRGGGRLFGTRE